MTKEIKITRELYHYLHPKAHEKLYYFKPSSRKYYLYYYDVD